MQTPDTVLIVEDEPLVRTFATVLIEEELGCRCEIATDRDEALRLLQDHAERIAVIFTDLQIASDSDGAELARIVSRRWPWVGILVTSGGVPPRSSTLPGKAKFVSKPWRPDEVKRFMASRLPRLSTGSDYLADH
jgi:CheY-like chemotaxis protein